MNSDLSSPNEKKQENVEREKKKNDSKLLISF